MSTDIKPGQVWAWKPGSDIRDAGTEVLVTYAEAENRFVRYEYPDGSAVPQERLRENFLDAMVLVREPDATPAPLDPSKVKAGDTVTLTLGKAKVEDEVIDVTTDDDSVMFLLAHNDAPGKTYLRVWSEGWTLTAHQPAPKPEWKPGTLAIVTPSMWGGIVNRALRGGDGNWHTEGGGFWSDDEVADVHELVVIDPAEVDVAHLAHVYDDAPGTERTGIRAVLAELRIEVAR